MHAKEVQDPKDAPFLQFRHPAPPDELKCLAYEFNLTYSARTQFYVVFNVLCECLMLYQLFHLP